MQQNGTYVAPTIKGIHTEAMQRPRTLGDPLKRVGLGLFLVALGALALSQGGLESTLVGVFVCAIGCFEAVAGYRSRGGG